MTKMTYVEALAIAINALEDAEAVEKLEALKAQLEKRNASRGQTKAQKANEGLKAEILAFVGEAGTVRAGDVATHFSSLRRKLPSSRWLRLEPKGLRLSLKTALYGGIV